MSYSANERVVLVSQDGDQKKRKCNMNVLLAIKKGIVSFPKGNSKQYLL